MEELRALVTNDSRAGAALKAKLEKSEEKDSSGFASSQPNHIYFCCRHGIEHPSPLFLLHPSPYAREDWQWDGAAGGAVVEVSLIALKSGEFRLLPFPPQAQEGTPGPGHNALFQEHKATCHPPSQDYSAPYFSLQSCPGCASVRIRLLLSKGERKMSLNLQAGGDTSSW